MGNLGYPFHTVKSKVKFKNKMGWRGALVGALAFAASGVSAAVLELKSKTFAEEIEKDRLQQALAGEIAQQEFEEFYDQFPQLDELASGSDEESEASEDEAKQQLAG